jgi:hypothetical protein
MRSTRGKDERLSWSRSPSHRHSRKKERILDRKAQRSITGLNRNGKSSTSLLTGRTLSPRRRRT